MSRIMINEADSSRQAPVLQDAHNVLIVGHYNKPEDAELTELKLYTSVKEFTKDYPEVPSQIYSRLIVGEADNSKTGNITIDNSGKTVNYKTPDYEAYDPGFMSYFVTKKLLSYGVGVYFLNIKSLSKSDKLLKSLSNKFMYDISFISLGGFNSQGITYTKIVNNIISVRKDCVLLADVPYGTEEPDTQEEINSIVSGLLGSPTDEELSYCSAYGPWTYHTYSIGEYMITGPIPPSYSVLECLGLSLYRGNPAYRALAGVNRGQITSAVGIEYNLSEDESTNIWQAKDGDQYNINPIIYLNNTYGYVIYGQRTLLKDRLSSLKSLNVRIAANMVKKRIFKVCLGLTFETNDLILWNEFKGQIDSYLANMQYNRGLYNYKVIMDSESQADSTDDMTVKGFVRCYFSRAAEYFDIDFTLTSNSAEFSEDNI